MYINAASFEARGYGAERARQQLANALNIWNVEGQANIRLTLVGDTSATSGQAGRINVWAGDVYGAPGSCTFAVAVWSSAGGTCDFAGIEIYWRGFNGCQHQPIDWTTDGPYAGAYQLGDVLVHELGHVIGGYSDNYPATDTVMRAVTSEAKSYHLYNKDIDLLRDGYLGNFAYGGRTNYLLRNMYSVNGVTWNSLSWAGSTNLKAGVAANASYIYAGFVDANSSAFQLKVMRSTTGGSWTSDTSFTAYSRSGVDLEATSSYVVLAYLDAGLARQIKTRRRSSSSWSTETSIAGNSRVAPALVWSPVTFRLVLFFVDRDTHRLKWSISTNEGSTWSTPAFLAVPEDLEFLAVDGPSGGCNNSFNECFLVWPTFGTYNAVTTSLCTQKFTISGSTLSLGDRSCFTSNSADPAGLAYGIASGYAGWVLGRGGRDTNQSLAFHRRSGFDASTDWPYAHVSTASSRAGVALEFVPTSGYDEWEVYYVSP